MLIPTFNQYKAIIAVADQAHCIEIFIHIQFNRIFTSAKDAH